MYVRRHTKENFVRGARIWHRKFSHEILSLRHYAATRLVTSPTSKQFQTSVVGVHGVPGVSGVIAINYAENVTWGPELKTCVIFKFSIGIMPDIHAYIWGVVHFQVGPVTGRSSDRLRALLWFFEALIFFQLKSSLDFGVGQLVRRQVFYWLVCSSSQRLRVLFVECA